MGRRIVILARIPILKHKSADQPTNSVRPGTNPIMIDEEREQLSMDDGDSTIPADGAVDPLKSQ